MAEPVPMPEDWSDRKAVEAWLRTQPREVCVALAARAALRVLPFPLVVAALNRDAPKGRRPIMLPVFRATAAAWLAAVGPSQGAEEKVRAAATFAADAFVSGFPADAAFAAAAATAAARAARTAAAAFAVAHVAARSAFAADAVACAAGHGAVARAALWPEGAPARAEEAWWRLRDHLLAADEGWEVWTGWYEARLRGDPVDVTLETRRVIEPTRWDDGPAAVNAEIAAIIADHEARKAEPGSPGPSAVGAAAQIAAVLDTPTLRAAYADFAVDAATATVRMVPMPGDIPVLADADLALDWRSRLEGLAIQPLDLIEHIRDARCNVPQALLKDLARYAHEAERGPDAVRPGVLDLYGRSLISAGEIEDITAALGDYLGGTLARIGDAHRRLMRDYHAQVTSRLNAAPVVLPEEATPAAVADAVEAVSDSLKQEPWGGVRATRDFTDLLDAQKEAFRAAAARLDVTEDAKERQDILDSISGAEVSALASISRYALRVREHVGSQSAFARRVGYAGDLVGLVESLVFGNVAHVIQTVLRWLRLV